MIRTVLLTHISPKGGQHSWSAQWLKDASKNPFVLWFCPAILSWLVSHFICPSRWRWHLHTLWLYIKTSRKKGIFFYVSNTHLIVIVQSLSRVWLCDPMDCSMPGSPVLHHLLELLSFMSTELAMLSNRLILCCPLLFLCSTFPSSGVFSNELAFRIRWPKYHLQHQFFQRTSRVDFL